MSRAGVSARTRQPVPQPMDDRLNILIMRTLEKGLSRLRGRRVHVRDLDRRFFRASSTFRTERLRVVLGGAEKPLRVFFKDLDPRHQVTDARTKQPRHRIPPRRELDMYRSILSRERFGTLDLYAFRWEAGRGRFWVFLEYAGRTPLNDVRDFSEWVEAAICRRRERDFCPGGTAPITGAAPSGSRGSCRPSTPPTATFSEAGSMRSRRGWTGSVRCRAA
jgi:hypothetical protein